MKFAPSAVLEALRAVMDRNPTGIFYGTADVALEFIPCRLTEEQMRFADHQQLLRNRSIIRSALLVDEQSAKEFTNEQYVEGAPAVRFELANYMAGGFGLTIEGREIEIERIATEINALQICCADQNGSGLVSV